MSRPAFTLRNYIEFRLTAIQCRIHIVFYLCSNERPTPCSKRGRNEDDAERLWIMSKELVSDHIFESD